MNNNCIFGQMYKHETLEELIYRYQTKRNHTHKEKSELIKRLLEERDELIKGFTIIGNEMLEAREYLK